MDITQLAPASVIGVAIAATALIKKFVPKKVFDRIVWLPPMVVGVAGAIVLGWGGEWQKITWDAITYGAIASYAVLVVKRVAKAV